MVLKIPPPIFFARRLFSLTTRLQPLTSNSPNALRAIEAAIRSYVSSESTARDLISTLWNISDRKLEDTASAVNAILDVLEDEDKRRNLLNSWNGFKVEVNQLFF
jgi:E3 ubiquitin-protein ligase ZNF598